MLIADASGLLAALDPREQHHQAAWAALQAAEPPRILSPFVLAELDYLIERHLGNAAQEVFLEDVASSVYEVSPFTAAGGRRQATSK